MEYPSQVIVTGGKRQVGAITSAERDPLVTVVLCMSAEGSFITPMIIFSRKKSNEQLKKGTPPSSLFAFRPSGWIQTHLFPHSFCSTQNQLKMVSYS